MIEILRSDWESAREQLLAVRNEVFVVEQKVPAEIEEDEYDPVAKHLIAIDESGAPLGTTRWIDSGDGVVRIGRVAVLREWRRKKIGTLLMKAALADAQKEGFSSALIHAQVSSVPFYTYLGFSLTGTPEFQEAGILHREMELALADTPFCD